MAKIILEHSKLPGQEIEVEENGFHHYEKSGWQRKNPDAAVPPPTGDQVSVLTTDTGLDSGSLDAEQTE